MMEAAESNLRDLLDQEQANSQEGSRALEVDGQQSGDGGTSADERTSGGTRTDKLADSSPVTRATRSLTKELAELAQGDRG